MSLQSTYWTGMPSTELHNIFTADFLMYWFPYISIIIRPEDTDPCNHIDIHASIILSKDVSIILILSQVQQAFYLQVVFLSAQTTLIFLLICLNYFKQNHSNVYIVTIRYLIFPFEQLLKIYLLVLPCFVNSGNFPPQQMN